MRSVRSVAAATALVLTGLTGCGSLALWDDPARPDAAPPAAASAPADAPAPDTQAPAPPPPSTPAPPPVSVAANVRDGARQVTVDTVVALRARAGTLTKVALTYQAPGRGGKQEAGRVPGTLSADKATWTAADRLEPGARYTLSTVARNASDAGVHRQTVRFRTQALSLDEQTYPTLQPFDGATVGVAMPVVLTFDVAVQDKAEVERHLRVTSTPRQPGSWHWYSDKEAHFRPRSYWRPGTKVTVAADLNGVRAGRGVYGQQSARAQFTVDRSLVTKINLAAKQAKVYRDGELVRRIPISAGKSGWQTRSGTKVIMDKLPTTRMTNEMIGAEENYDLRVRYALRVTWSGEFLHAAPWNAGKFGRINASHGCVGMSTDDAAWLFHQVRIGDPVETTGSSRGLEAGNGWTDWDVSYGEYRGGSALS